MKFKMIDRDRDRMTVQIDIPGLFFTGLFSQTVTLSFDRKNDRFVLQRNDEKIERSLAEISACCIDTNPPELVLWRAIDDAPYGRRFLGERIAIASGREGQLQSLQECIETFLGDRHFEIIYDGSYGTWIATRNQNYLELHYETLMRPVFFASTTYYCEFAYLVDLNLGELKVVRNTLNLNENSQIFNDSETCTYPIDAIEGWSIESDGDSGERIILQLGDRSSIPISRYMEYFPTAATRDKQYGGYGPAKFAINTLKAFIELRGHQRDDIPS